MPWQTVCHLQTGDNTAQPLNDLTQRFHIRYSKSWTERPWPCGTPYIRPWGWATIPSGICQILRDCIHSGTKPPIPKSDSSWTWIWSKEDLDLEEEALALFHLEVPGPDSELLLELEPTPASHRKEQPREPKCLRGQCRTARALRSGVENSLASSPI